MRGLVASTGRAVLDVFLPRTFPHRLSPRKTSRGAPTGRTPLSICSRYEAGCRSPRRRGRRPPRYLLATAPAWLRWDAKGGQEGRCPGTQGLSRSRSDRGRNSGSDRGNPRQVLDTTTGRSERPTRRRDSSDESPSTNADGGEAHRARTRRVSTVATRLTRRCIANGTQSEPERSRAAPRTRPKTTMVVTS